jgi:hypothetical protein
MSFYVYLLANRRNGTLYIGMTDDIANEFGCIGSALFQASQSSME